MVLWLIVIFGLAVVIANVRVTRAVLKDEFSTSGQRAAQIAIVWLIPLLGAMFTLHFKRKDDEPSEGRYREILNPGDDMVSATHYPPDGREGAGFDVSGSSDGGSND